MNRQHVLRPPHRTIVRTRIRRALRAIPLLLLAAVLVACPGCKKKKLNHAAYFGHGGYADTDLEMMDFFLGNHTLAAWFMPQYPRIHIGVSGVVMSELLRRCLLNTRDPVDQVVAAVVENREEHEELGVMVVRQVIGTREATEPL